MIWITEKILELLCWRKLHIKATCISCGKWTNCGRVPDIGFACEECQVANLWIPARRG